MSAEERNLFNRINRDPRLGGKYGRSSLELYHKLVEIDKRSNEGLLHRYLDAEEACRWKDRNPSEYYAKKRQRDEEDKKSREHRIREYKRMKRAKKKKRHRGGKGATARRNAAKWERFKKDISYYRRVDYAVRYVGHALHNDDVAAQYPNRVTPLLGVSHSMQRQDLSTTAQQFYARCGCGDNPYLVIKKRFTICNFDPDMDNGGWGVVARQDIAPGTIVCPYVGEVLEQVPKNSAYTVKLGPGVYVDAQRFRYDVGYIHNRCQRLCAVDRAKAKQEALQKRIQRAQQGKALCHRITRSTASLDDPGYVRASSVYDNVYRAMDEAGKCPHNYGRYINSLNFNCPFTSRIFNPSSFNCRLIADPDGHDGAFVVSNTFISKGTELLVDYGNEYAWPASAVLNPSRLDKLVTCLRSKLEQPGKRKQSQISK